LTFGKRFTTSGGNPARRDPTFQQRTYDEGLGIYDYRNRSFDPATGRFLQRDPVLDEANLYNPYAGMGNNPVGNVDPMGTEVTVRGRANAQKIIDKLKQDMDWDVVALAWNAHDSAEFTAKGDDWYLLIPMGAPKKPAGDKGLGSLVQAIGSANRHARLKWVTLSDRADAINDGYDNPDYEFTVKGIGVFTGSTRDLRTRPVNSWEYLYSYKRMYGTVGIEKDYRRTSQKFAQWYCTEFYPRVAGTVKAIAGGLEMLAGLTFALGTAKTGVGFAAGLAVTVHGEDVMISGLKGAVSGAPVPGMTEKLLQAGGMSAADAAALDTLISVAGTMGTSLPSSLGKGGAAGITLSQAKGGAATLAITGQAMSKLRALHAAIKGGAILFARAGKTGGKKRSPHRIGRRMRFSTRKGAYEAAKRAGKGVEPVYDGSGKHGPHFHPGKVTAKGKIKPLNHDHYYFPKSH